METKQNDPPPNIDQKVLIPAYKKALLYAHKKLQRFNNSGIKCKIEPLDLVHEACEKTISRKRQWNPKQTPDLFVHLAGCIDSILSNIYTSADFNTIDRSESSQNFLMHQAESCSEENSRELDSKISFIIDYIVAAREDMQTITELMLREGVTEPKEIASVLNIPVSEVNAKKIVLKRIMKRISFKLHYISRNRQDLLEIARAVYIEKVTNVKELSKILKISTDEVKQQMQELNCVIKEISRGVI